MGMNILPVRPFYKAQACMAFACAFAQHRNQETLNAMHGLGCLACHFFLAVVALIPLGFTGMSLTMVLLRAVLASIIGSSWPQIEASPYSNLAGRTTAELFHT